MKPEDSRTYKVSYQLTDIGVGITRSLVICVCVYISKAQRWLVRKFEFLA